MPFSFMIYLNVHLRSTGLYHSLFFPFLSDLHLFSPIIQVPESSNVRLYIELLHQEFLEEMSKELKQPVLDGLYTIIFNKLERLKQFQTFHIQNSARLETFMGFKNLIQKYFTQSRNADFYAEKLNITYKHLNVICQDIADTTAKQFIDEFIILESKRRLINSSIKSNELAYQMGFNEPTNFIKYFKKNTGFTPNTFKNSYN